MIKVSVMYANTPGARFDHTYLIKARLGMQALQCEQGPCWRACAICLPKHQTTLIAVAHQLGFVLHVSGLRLSEGHWRKFLEGTQNCG